MVTKISPETNFSYSLLARKWLLVETDFSGVYVSPASVSSCTTQKPFLILEIASFSRKTSGK